MLGYVTADKPELKMREFEVYTGYYCGVCKSIARRYGQLPRMVLSYDAAFLALLLAGLFREEDAPVQEHCLAHPVKKKTVVANAAIDYAADVMLILAWFKLLDDIHDEKQIKARLAAQAMKRTYRRLEAGNPRLCEKVQAHLDALTTLEEERCASLDKAAEAFAKIMEAIFEEGPQPEGFKEQEVLRRIGYHLGKWIYLMDALDDLEENVASGAYNPLLYRFAYQGTSQGTSGRHPGAAAGDTEAEKENERDTAAVVYGGSGAEKAEAAETAEPEPAAAVSAKKAETVAEFKARIMETCRFNLLQYLAEIGKATDLLALRKNRSIIENIVYKGLLRKTEHMTRKEK